MPNRILRDWTDSEAVDLLTAESERLFTRIFMKADDYGSYHANVKLIRSTLFPLKTNIREADISRWMEELLNAGLILFYEVDEKKYLRVINFGQRLRSMKKLFPHPPDSESRASRGKSPPETKRNETESETKLKRNETNAREFGEIVFYDLDLILEKLLADEIWIEVSAKNLRAEISEIRGAVPEFVIHLKAQDTHQKSLKDAKQHFNNWYPKRKAKKNEHTNSDIGGKIGRTKVSAIQEFMQQPIINQSFNGDSET